MEMLNRIQDAGQQAHAMLIEASSRAPGSLMTQTLVVGVLVGFLTYRLMKKQYRLPPGPWPLPLLGNVLSLISKKETLPFTMDRWAREKYGPVISVYLGPMLCIILNDFNTINEALVEKGHDFAGRPFVHSLDVLTEGNKDIVIGDYSPRWKLHRKIAMKALRHYMTGSHLNKVIHGVMRQVADKMAAEQSPFNPLKYTSALMVHIIDCICFGEVKPYDDPSIHRNIELFDILNQAIGKGLFEDVIPLLKYWPTKKFRTLQSANSELRNYIEKNIQQHRKTFSADKNVRDVTHSILLAQMEAAREESAEVMAMFTDVHVRQTIFDLFVAGIDTSRNTLVWALLFMAGYPEIQKRAQVEIDAVTGTEMPGVDHRSQLRYTQAVLQECMRLGPAVPMAVPHKTLCDTTVGGYEVPKGTMVLVNVWAVSRDPKLWDQPEKFRPERFLDEQGQLKPTPKFWLPFSIGRRACLGETVARPELLLLLASFLKRFTIALPEGASFEPRSEVPGSFFANLPKPFKIVVKPR